MSTINIYLAGPILGLTKNEAKGWRTAVSRALTQDGFNPIDPLRCEPMVGEKYLPHHEHIYGTPKGITGKNWMDVDRSDLVLAYFPIIDNGKRPSYGTLIELGFAYALRKPIVIATKDQYVKDHPIIQTIAPWMVDTLEEACETVTDLMGDYQYVPR